MIEAEFWDYDSEDEMAAAVAGDVGFIIESAIDARGNALIALPGGNVLGLRYRASDAVTEVWRLSVAGGESFAVGRKSDCDDFVVPGFDRAFELA